MHDYRPNWWQRNWKWFVPVGCLSTVLLFAGGIALLLSFVFGMMKSNGAYAQALTRAKASPAVIAALGTPITDGYLTSGSIQESGPSGSAALSIPISGPKGSATIFLEAHESAGRWAFSKLEVEIAASQRRIDLLTEPEKAAAPLPSPADPDGNDAAPGVPAYSSSI